MALGWQPRDLTDVTDRVFAAWLRRECAYVRATYNQWGSALEARTDGASIWDGYGECLLTRACDSFLVLISGKRYPPRRDERWLIYGLAEIVGKSGIDSVIVKAPELAGTVYPDSLNTWWKAELEWRRGGEGHVAERYLAAARQMLAALSAGDEWMFRDGFRCLEVVARTVWVQCEPLVTVAPDNAMILSGLRYRVGSERFRFRESLRFVLDESGVRYRVAHPKRHAAITQRQELLAAGEASRIKVFE